MNTNRSKKERVQKLLQIHANKTTEIESVSAGNIVAIVGTKFTTTGDTLIAAKDKALVELAGMAVPEPVIFQSVEAKTAGDQAALMNALERVKGEDPSFRVKEDPESGQLLIGGMGELHLEVIVHRLEREFRVAARVGKPQVAYRESVTRSLRKELVYDREIGGKRQYARVVVEVEPGERGSSAEVESTLDLAGANADVPREWHDAALEGARDALTRGPVLGYPVVDVKGRLIEVEGIEGASSAASFRAAGTMALSQAIEDVGASLLEPVMALEVVVPESFTGNVHADLSGRRGRVLGMESQSNAQIVSAEVPLDEMFGYATSLRSTTQGRASYTMQFSRYAIVPPQVCDSVTKRIRGY